VLKWACAGLTVVLLLAWGYGATRYIDLRYPNWSITLTSSSLDILRIGGPEPPTARDFTVLRTPPSADVFYWKSGSIMAGHSNACAQLHLPLWIPLACLAVVTGALPWVDYRFRFAPGHCQNCGYNLTGNVSGRCPECGTPIEHEGRPA
jgi:hypothetical protein